MDNLRSFPMAFRETMSHLTTIKANPKNRSIALPFPALEKAFKGLRLGELTVLGGLEGHGKSALAQQIGLYAASSFAQDEGKQRAVLYCSMEMGYQLLIYRLIVQQSAFNYDLLLSPHLMSEENWEQLLELERDLSGWPFIIDDTAILTSADIKSTVELLNEEFDVRLVVVDYLQLLEDPMQGRDASEAMRLDSTTKRLKEIARLYDLHVIALSSLNNSLDDSGSPNPRNIRGSGGIRFAADNVCLLHRPYLVSTSYGESWKNIGLFKITKARNGPVGSHYLKWNSSYLTFTEATRNEINLLNSSYNYKPGGYLS